MRINADGSGDLTYKLAHEDILGTKFQGRVFASYAAVAAIFGEPDEVDPNRKTHYEWRIDTPAGAATLYDWKLADWDPKEIIGSVQWHIGGRTDEVIPWITKALAKVTVAELAADESMVAEPIRKIPMGPIDEPLWEAIPGAGLTAPRGAQSAIHLQALTAVLEDIELGAYDQRIVEWLAGWDRPTVAAVCSLLLRARTAGSEGSA
jgi:hypothetical protein